MFFGVRGSSICICDGTVQKEDVRETEQFVFGFVRNCVLRYPLLNLKM